MKYLSILMLVLSLAACSKGGDGSQRDDNVTSDITGPTQPNVVVNCLGDTIIDTDVDCGDRNSVPPAEGE